MTTTVTYGEMSDALRVVAKLRKVSRCDGPALLALAGDVFKGCPAFDHEMVALLVLDTNDRFVPVPRHG